MRGIFRFLIFAATLAVLLLLSSCGNDREGIPYDGDRRLEIEPADKAYSAELIEDSAEAFADIGVELYGRMGVAVSRADMRNLFKQSVIYCLYDAGIYAPELAELNSRLTSGSLPDIYYSLLYTVGAERTGGFAYYLSVSWLESQARTAREKYEKTSLAFYLDEAARFDALSADIKESLGRESFGFALSTLGFVCSVGSILEGGDRGGIPLSAREILFILDKQSEYCLQKSISEAQWQIFARLITELTPPYTRDLLGAEAYALKNEGYFVRAINVMPSLIALYRAAAEAAYKEGRLDLSEGWDLYETEEEARAARLPALLSALLGCPEELSAFLGAVGEHCAIASKREADMLKEKGLDGAFAEFAEERKAVSQQMLTEKMVEAAEGRASAEELKAAFTDHLYSIAPYLTFVIHSQP